VRPLIAFVLVLPFLPRMAGAQPVAAGDSVFRSSLHYTARGMGYWYDKENGGLETVTGVPYSELGCANCHAASCGVCHETKTGGKAAYSTGVARDQAKCLSCHAREASMLRIDKSQGSEDVHVRNGMQCMNCHTASDVHGDGTGYASMREAGAVAPKCEGCHETTTQSASHTAHSGKLDCKACHVRQVVSCTNCHFETLVRTGKRVSVPVSGWVFLVNYGGKVTSANMQTFVAKGNRTFLMFAPQFSHSVMAKGRTCPECHATETAVQAGSKTVRLLWLDKGEVRQARGAIPVAAGARYELVFQDYRDGKWSVIEDPVEPPIHYAGYGEPLTSAQVEKLAQAQPAR
jgi:hypothetical protein